MANRGKSVECFVYFIQAESGGPIKIGHSVCPEARLSNFQMGCPVKLRIVAQFPGKEDWERHLHKKFKPHRRHGEWFEPSDEVMAFIVGLGIDPAPVLQKPFKPPADETTVEMAIRIAPKLGCVAIPLVGGGVRLQPIP